MPKFELAAFPLSSYGTLDKVVRQCLFPHLWNGDNSTYLVKLGFNELTYVKRLEHYWEWNKCYVRGLIVLLCVYHVKAGFSGKDNAGENRRQQETMRWIDSIKEAICMSLQELSRSVEDRTLGQNSFVACQESEPTQWHVIHKKLYATRVEVTTSIRIPQFCG